MGFKISYSKFRYYSAVTAGKIVSFVLRKILKSSASAAPGKVAMTIYPDILRVVNDRCQKKIIITGTNGKTTTNNLLTHILTREYPSVLSNLRGANMPQGLVSAFLHDRKKEYDWGVFEVDEGSFERVTEHLKPDYVLVTNFFRDQLDRYGEIEKAFQDILESLESLDTTLILNADDPLVSNFRKLHKRNIYYGVTQNQYSSCQQGIVESRFCPACSSYLDYDYYNYGQLGGYQCPDCGFSNPDYDYQITEINYQDHQYHYQFKNKNQNMQDITFAYEGIYNAYNCCAALSTALEVGLPLDKVAHSIEEFEYHLGRMENFQFPGKIVKIALVKNPIGLSETISSIFLDEREKSMLFVLNDNPADGKDVSWIWDAEVEKMNNIKNINHIYCSGRRAEDIALRLKYAGVPVELVEVDDKMDNAIEKLLNEDVEIAYLLPTYTAVFQARELVLARLEGSGKKMSHIREYLKNLKFPGR
ncbi:Mur ligase family protein [Methanobacterium formicicum]|uniref:Mur ligase family protein n=1 Tax=Methanobacterium formicicum TaxID=2162 RepID=UPI000AD4F6FA|nr:Mur ligase family protein [Methanobacterium formicicum]